MGGPGAPEIFFGGSAPRALLKFQTWCTPDYGEGEGNFSRKNCQNVGAKTVAIQADIFWTPMEFLLAEIFTRVTELTDTGV